MANTLLLTMSYEPIGAISWQRALSLLFLNKAELIEEYTDKHIRSVSICLKMPAVIRLVNKIRGNKSKKTPAIKFSRTNIYTRDGFKCQYCGEEKNTNSLNLDHVVPRSSNGETTWENIVTSCILCNTHKGNRTPEQANMKLLKKPYKPTWLPKFSIKPTGNFPDQWISYLYWTTEIKSMVP